MPDKEKQIMEACGKLILRLTDQAKERFLTFTEGMAFLSSRQIYTTDAAPRPESRT